jgi:methylmalonyl-CoA/ethylmalonyl-CoA epimerase
MTEEKSKARVLELRVAVTTDDFVRLTKFYFDSLGIAPAQFWDNGQGQAVILDMGKATLEIFDETQAETIDRIEAGKRVSGHIRFALQVPDLQSAIDRLLSQGATMVHPPVVTPWGDTNVRFEDPDGLQLTLFQKTDNSQDF